MGPYVLRVSLLVLKGPLSVLIGPHGSLCVLVGSGSYGSISVLMGHYWSLWVLMSPGLHGSL